MCVRMYVYIHTEKKIWKDIYKGSPLVNTLVYLGCGVSILLILFVTYNFFKLDLLLYNHVIVEMSMYTTKNFENNDCQELLD